MCVRGHVRMFVQGCDAFLTNTGSLFSRYSKKCELVTNMDMIIGLTRLTRLS